jgi:hypothetical protein
VYARFLVSERTIDDANSHSLATQTVPDRLPRLPQAAAPHASPARAAGAPKIQRDRRHTPRPDQSCSAGREVVATIAPRASGSVMRSTASCSHAATVSRSPHSDPSRQRSTASAAGAATVCLTDRANVFAAHRGHTYKRRLMLHRSNLAPTAQVGRSARATHVSARWLRMLLMENYTILTRPRHDHTGLQPTSPPPSDTRRSTLVGKPRFLGTASGGSLPRGKPPRRVGS